MSILFLFVDGVGLGARDAATNPFAAKGLELLSNFAGETPRELPFGGICTGLDASMGVEGRPQSATGQTALLTGLNAARENGGHLMGFPNALLRGLLEAHSVLKRLRQRGRKVVFANAFRPMSFLLPPALQRRRMSATTVATLAARIPLLTVWEIPIGEALFHDFTNEGLSDQGYAVEPRSPEEAGQVLAGICSRHDFTLYEYFRTDKAGHAQDMQLGAHLLRQFERFLKSLLASLDLKLTTVLLASDHGNLEDLSHGGHTLNQALCMLWGRGNRQAVAHLSSLTDVTGVLLDLDRETVPIAGQPASSH